MSTTTASPHPQLRTLHRGSAIQFGALRSWTTYTCDLPIDALPDELAGFRIVHLSDTHFGPRWHSSYDRLLAEIEAFDAHVVAFTGDWIDDKFDYRPGLATMQRFARGLRARLGVFSCLGNHDGDLIAPYLVDAGVRTLVGDLVRIVGGDASIEIIGLPGVTREDLSRDLLASLGEPAPDAFRLLLAHFPDQVRQVQTLAPHLVLAGHTHGGQICLPTGRPLITHDALPWRQSRGLHRIGSTWLHVSRGVGCSAWPVRAFCPPEITLFNLARASAPQL